MTRSNRRTIIGVMGGADPDTPHEVMLQAETAGQLIARAGAVLLCGGRTGVMEAAARGAKSVAGGETLAILPGMDRDSANPYIDLAVATGMGNGRNIINVLSSDAVIAFPGGMGTLSEIALAVKCGIPTISFMSWDPTAARCGDLQAVPEHLFHLATDPREAVEKALALGDARSTPAEEASAALVEALESHDRHWNGKDLPGILEGYWPGAETVVILGGVRMSGTESLAAYLHDLFDERNPGAWQRRVVPQSVSMRRSGGDSWSVDFNLEVVLPGNRIESWWGSAVFLRREQRYLMLQEHLSVDERPDLEIRT